jgi:topoisomerase-4 subunit A
LIQIPPADFSADKDEVVAVCLIAEGSGLKVLSGKRHVSLKRVDIEAYSGARAKRGLALPRGFQRVDSIVSEDGV